MNLVAGKEFNGLPLCPNITAFNGNHLHRLEKLIYFALEVHPRLTAIRVDLDIPDYLQARDLTRIMNRFFCSLKAKITHELNIKINEGIGCHYTEIYYAWAREIGKCGRIHYHLVLLFNKDRYYRLGDVKFPESLANRIASAWGSALGGFTADYVLENRLVNFPPRAVYHLNKNTQDWHSTLKSLFQRASYLAKLSTKDPTYYTHTFQTSQICQMITRQEGSSHGGFFRFG